MKKLLILLCIFASSNAMALQRECVAIAEGASNAEAINEINFTIISERVSALQIKFDQKIAWHPEALEFQVIYSKFLEDGSGRLLIASEVNTNNDQMLEFHFESYPRLTNGTLKAGDQNEVDGRIGKYLTYSISCQQMLP